MQGGPLQGSLLFEHRLPSPAPTLEGAASRPRIRDPKWSSSGAAWLVAYASQYALICALEQPETLSCRWCLPAQTAQPGEWPRAALGLQAAASDA